jgi:hypothetical protein
MSNEQNPPESRDHRTGHGQTAYKRALAYEHLGIHPASVPCLPFFRASLTRIARLLNRPRRNSERLRAAITPFDCLQASDHPDACKVSRAYPGKGLRRSSVLAKGRFPAPAKHSPKPYRKTNP